MRRLSLTLVAAFIVLAFAQALAGTDPRAAAPASAAAQDEETFMLGEGRFKIEGRKPPEFASVGYLYLEGAQLRRGGDFRRLAAVPPAAVRGELYGRRLKYKIRRAAFDGEKFSFETQPVGGISFEFSGTVFNGATAADQFISPAFKGRLAKLQNGRKVAEAEVTLGHLEPEF